MAFVQDKPPSSSVGPSSDSDDIPSNIPSNVRPMQQNRPCSLQLQSYHACISPMYAGAAGG